MTLKKAIEGMKAGQDTLNRAKVMPLGLMINGEKWSYYKYKALPGHPTPGNAGRGFTHPHTPKGVEYKDVLSASRSPRGEAVNLITPEWTDSEAWEKLVMPIIKSIGWDAKDVTAYYARTDLGLEAVDIARGGIVVWEDYPSDMEDVGTRKEKSRIKKLRDAEPIQTDEYVKAYLSKIGRKGGSVTSPAKAAAVRENGKKGGRPAEVIADTRKGSAGHVEQSYSCPYCGKEYRLSQLDFPQTGKVICGDDGLGGIEDGCGKAFIVKAADPYGRKPE